MTISGGITPVRVGADIPAAVVPRAPFAPTQLPYTAMSITSQVNISSSSIYTFEIQSDMAWQKGARVRALSHPTGTWLEGVVTSYVGTALTFRSDRSFIGGAGPYADWTITIAGEVEIENQVICSGESLDANLIEANFLGAVTFTLKTLLTGLDPSPENPVIFQTPNGTTRVINSPLSLTIPYLATLGMPPATPFRLWFALIDDFGYDPHIGVIQTRNPTNHSIAAFQGRTLANTVSPPGNSSGVFYSDITLTNQSYVVLGFADYDNGLATAGVWNVSPTRFVFYANGAAMPGDVIQVVMNKFGAPNSAVDLIPWDNSAPQITEGAEFLGVDITPLSRSSVLTVETQAALATDPGVNFTASLFQQYNTNAIASTWQSGGRAALQMQSQLFLGHVNPTHFSLRAGRDTATGTPLSLNGIGATGYYGGVFNSFIRVVERMT